jgi:N6-adenosine-specific RNA methylase IME4
LSIVYELKIDPEFHELIPPLQVDELRGLEDSIVAEGCRDPIVVWDDILIDGHNRYDICQRLRLPFVTVARNFSGRDQAKLWIIRNQFARRNLTPYQRAELVLLAEPLLAASAKERQRAGGVEKVQQNSAEPQVRDQLADLSGLSHDTVHRARVIRDLADEETKGRLRSGELSINRAYQETRRSGRAKDRIAAAELPAAKYRVIYADPPWEYPQAQHSTEAQATTLDTHYPSMSIEELCEMEVSSICENDAVLFLWATSPKLEDSFQVIRAWGFKYKASMVWDKIKHNVGHYVSVRHEFLLICTRGSCKPDVSTLHDSVVSIERTTHSTKPEHFRTLIDSMYPHGKRIELFARKATEGWDVYGNEAG